MAQTMTEVTIKTYTENDFSRACAEISKLATKIAGDRRRIAELLAPMSALQLKRAGKLFKPFFGRFDVVERLALMGRGEMPEYLALKDYSIRAKVWELLFPAVKETLSDPSYEVAIRHENGATYFKPAMHVTPVEWVQVIGGRKLLAPDEQDAFHLKRDQKKPESQRGFNAVKIQRCEDGSGYTIVNSEDQRTFISNTQLKLLGKR